MNMQILGNRIEVLSHYELYEVHMATMEVLEKVGVKVLEQNALKLLKDAGAIINERKGVAHIPEYLVNESLKKAPSHVTLYGRGKRYKLNIGGYRVHFSMEGTSLFVLDLETGERRASTYTDLERFFKLADALENIHHASITVKARDIPESIAHVYEMYAGFKNTTKTIDGYTYGQTVAMDTIKMASIIAGGEEELIKRPMLLGFHNPVSPLQHSKELTEGLMVYARYKQPVIIAPECQAGATAPVTLAGLLVQQNAEVLSGIVIAELTNPGAPVLYGTVSTIMDMKTGNIAYGAVEAALINVATAQLARFYNLPSRGTGGGTESKIPDIQAGIEKAVTLMMAAMAGINFIYVAAGALESTLTASYEQAVIDNELCGMVLRALRGIEVNDETLAVDVIEEVGPGGHFLTKKHTLKHLKTEHFIPTILNRQTRDLWEKCGSKDLRQVARERAKEILSKHQPEPLEPSIEKELIAFIREVEKREKCSYKVS
ncbi:MAG: trimethylamine methyltransferase family protein [archaeon YNP-LCB-003-016]|nr:trimethylamine methyltransferase family protein [Candidatus Culexarchaeum yellowstonense]